MPGFIALAPVIRKGTIEGDVGVGVVPGVDAVVGVLADVAVAVGVELSVFDVPELTTGVEFAPEPVLGSMALQPASDKMSNRPVTNNKMREDGPEDPIR